GRLQAVEEAAQVLGQGRHLLLLALQGDDGRVVLHLQEEDALARRADRAGGQDVGAGQVVAGHDGARARGPPAAITASTIGPSAVYWMALTEHGEITMRWNRSRWVPMAWATAALMGSACDTATTTSPGCAARRRSSSVQMRVCISVNDSPPGKRKPLGLRCTVRHSGSLDSRFSSAPVQSPKSASSRPLARRTRRPRARAIGAAVSWVRSSGDAYTAPIVRLPSRRAAMRSATASACSRPRSERCRPGARPGSTWPVVGVCPWRTSSTSVGGGVVERARAIVGATVPAWTCVGAQGRDLRRRGSRVGSSGMADPSTRALLAAVEADVVACRACPRLVAWREAVAAERRAAFRDQEYWGRPVPGFGDPEADVMVVGLAPAAHGANRTGRMFTGDRSGDFLYAALHRTGFANQPTSTSVDDGLELTGAWITAPVRCAPPANKPTPEERDRCRPFLEREVALIDPRVFVVLGGFGYQVLCSLLGVRP